MSLAVDENTSFEERRGEFMAAAPLEYLRDASGIYGAFVSANGEIVDGDLFIAADSYPHQPKAAWGNDKFVVVWESREDEVNKVFGVVVSATGTNQFSERKLIAQGRTPSITWDGRQFLVVWEYQNDIHGSRMSGDGEILDPGGFLISSAPSQQGKPTIASGVGLSLVAWEDSRRGLLDIYAARIRSDPE